MITKLQVKYIQSLGQKQFRNEAGVFVAEGPKIINELLAAAVQPKQLYATRHWIEKNTNLLKDSIAGKIVEIKEQELERISFLQTPHEVLAIFPQPAVGTLHFLQTISLMLDGIQDP